MEITCIDCGTYLGSIRDATLKKEISFMCKDCKCEHDALKLMKESDKHRNGKTSFNDIFGDVFSGKK
jgi:hypothetical protein